MTSIENNIVDDTLEYISKETYGFPETEKLLNKLILKGSILKTLKECNVSGINSLPLSIDKDICLDDKQCYELLNKIKTTC